MPLYDERGNIISEAGPNLDEVRRSFAIEKSRHGGSANTAQWPFFAVHPNSLGRLTFKLLRNIYEVSSSIRPAVDGISRSVAHLPWSILHRDRQYHPPEETKKLMKFFRKPNFDGDSLAIILARFINDLLVVGKGVIEKVRNPLGQIIEIVARDAALFKPIYDPLGNIVGYQEFHRDTFKPKFIHPKMNIIFRYFTPTSYTLGGVPIIETVVNEVALMMLSVKAIGWAFTHDEIPPGVLHLGEISDVALQRAKSSFEAGRGLVGGDTGKIRVVDNVDKVDWVQFTRPFREMQVAELMPIIERIIARNFGLAPVESNLASTGRDADVSIRASQSKLIIPLSDMIADALTRGLIDESDDDIEFRFVRIPQEKAIEQAQSNTLLTRGGLITPNEARFGMGFPPKKGGDKRYVLLGNELVPIDEETGLPQYRNPVVGIPPSSQRGALPAPGGPPGSAPLPPPGVKPEPPATTTPSSRAPVPPKTKEKPEEENNNSNNNTARNRRRRRIRKAFELSGKENILDDEVLEDLELNEDDFEEIFDLENEELNKALREEFEKW